MSSIAIFFTDSIIYRTDSSCNRLHQSEEFSDCKLICGPYNFNLHKVILASQSDYFRTAFKQGTFEVMMLSAE